MSTASPLIELKVEGMDCTSCANSITQYLERQGFQEVYVNFQTKDVQFKLGSPETTLEKATAGITKLGYTVLDTQEGSTNSTFSLGKLTFISIIFTLPLLLGHIAMMLGVSTPVDNAWVQLLLCIPVYMIGAYKFGRSAYGSLRNGTPNMDVLIIIGATAAFVYSIIGTLQHQHDYIFYETAATIISLVLIGNWLEQRAIEQTTSAIQSLESQQPQFAHKKMTSGTIVKIPVQALQVGDIVSINQGDAIPTDGKIVFGQGSTNEAMITGESIPVYKSLGDALIGATYLSEGQVEMEVTAVGQATVLQKIIDLVKNANRDKPNIQRLADKISGIFVPAVLGISLLTFLVTYFMLDLGSKEALMRSIAVLVISCPCAMGLATPMAVMVGVGRMAKQGILVRGATTMETLAKIKNIVFDKTGTLTTGAFYVSSIDIDPSLRPEVESVLLAMESRSSHPIAVSIVHHLKGREVQAATLSHFREIPGKGLEATTEKGDVYLVGSHRILENPPLVDYPVYVLMNGAFLGGIQMSDNLKVGIETTLSSLKNQGVHPILLSGDKNKYVEKVAKTLGIQEWYGEQLPEDKIAKLEQWVKVQPTAMVGDGINDAPALAKATIGVSLSDATQAAIQSSQIVLLNGRIDKLADAMKISKGTLVTIKQNLFWAFAYNIVAIPIAAMGFLNPMWGALFMGFSDIVIFGNSLRLKYRKL